MAFRAESGGWKLDIAAELEEGQEIYLLKTMDNPVNQIRTTILIRSNSKDPRFHLTIKE